MRSLFLKGGLAQQVSALLVSLVLLALVVSLAWLGWTGVVKAQEPVDAIRFVQFSDVHYDAQGKDTSWRLLKDSPTLLQDALEGLLHGPASDFLLFTGDSVNTPAAENFVGFFQTLKAHNSRPVYMVLGNHDVGVRPHRTRQDTINAFRREGGMAMFPSAQDGWYRVQLKPWLRLLVLDGTTDTQVSANGFAGPAQLAWLWDELKDAEQDRQMVILASHFPVVEPFHSKSHVMVQPDQQKLLALIDGCPNVVAYFAGHYHSARIQQRQGVYYVTAPALVEYPNALRHVTITRDGHMKLAWLPSVRPDLSAKSKSRSPFWQTALGNPDKDHSLAGGKLRFVPPSP